MADWVLVPCLAALQDEFDKVAPGRDRRSEGTIGDPDHAGNSSDHNPDETGRTPQEDSDGRNDVRALDVDDTGPWPDWFNFDERINWIAERHRRGLDDRLLNIIRNGRIISRSWGWSEWRTYTGSNGHYEHAHFSALADTGAKENDTSPWGVHMNLTPADAQLVVDELMKETVHADMGSFRGCIQTLMRRTDQTTNKDMPALRGDVDELQDQQNAMAQDLAEIKGLLHGQQPS